MSMGYDATAGLPPLNYTTSFTNPGQWTMGNNAYLGGQGQEVLGGILQDTQRSQQRTADLITSAAMAMPNSPQGAYAGSDTGGPAGGWGGNAFNQGAISNYMTGGGGYNFPSIPDYSGGLGSGGNASSINWNTLFGGSGLGASGFDLGGMQNWAGNWNMPGGGGSELANSNFGAGMFGGLGGGMGGAGQGPNNQLDFTKLFDSGGGGPKTDPYPGMAWPGGQNSPMTMPQQQPQDFSSLFGQGVGGTGGAPQQPPYTSGIAPDETGGRTFGERFDALGGSAPMGDSAPAAPRIDDVAPKSNLSEGLLGYTPQQWPDSAYDKPSDPAMDQPLPGNPYTDPQGGGLSAADMGEQARTKLAELVSAEPAETVGGPTGRTAESAREAGGAVPPAATPRTGYNADLDFLSKRGGHNSIIMDGRIVPAPLDKVTNFKPLSPELAGRLARAARDYEAATGKRANFGEFSRGNDVQKIYWDRYQAGGGIAAPPGSSRHQAGNAGDIGRGEFRNWLQANGGTYGVHFPVRGDPVHVQMNPSYRGPAYAQPDSVPRPPADIPYPQGIPLPAERPAEAGPAAAPAEATAVPLETRPGVNQGQDITPPPANIPSGTPFVNDGTPFGPPIPSDYKPPAAAPVKHSGLELARANIDTPIEKIAMERFGQKGVDEVSSMVRGMTPRQIYESYGGMFTSRAEPLFKGLGITRQDFEKAVAMPQTKQDLKMRFGEGTFGPYPDYTGPEAAPAGDGNWQLPMPSTLHPDITDERGLPATEPVSAAVGSVRPQSFADLPNAAGAIASDGAGTVAPNSWNVPKEGTPEWNQQVYEPAFGGFIMRRNEITGGAGHYADFPRTGNVEDRRNEQLPRDQLAALKARGASFVPGPEVAPTPLGIALGLGDLPMPRGVTAAGSVRPQSLADLPNAAPSGPVDPSGAKEFQTFEDMMDQSGYTPSGWSKQFTDAPGTVGPRSSAFGFDPGGFGEGGYGNTFEPLGDTFKERFPAEGAFAPTPTTKTTDEFVPTRSISERAPSLEAEQKWLQYGGVGNAEVGPPQYNGFEQPYGPEYQPGAYTREQFANRADFTAQDQAERLAGQRAAAGAQIAADPELRRNTIATVLAEMGPNQTDENRLKVIESALNRLSATNYPTGMYKILGYRNAAGGYDPAGSPIQRAHQDRQYYEPFKYGERGEEPVVRARGYAVMRDQPALAEHVGKLLDAAIKTGTNVSNLATENSSDPISARQLRLGLQSPTEAATIPGSGPELFSRKDINTPAAMAEHGDPTRYRNWLAGLMPPGWQWQQQPASSIPNFPAQWRR